MELKPGYRQTEAGVIPEDWEVKSLKEIAELTSSRRIFEGEYVSTGVPFYRGTEINLLIDNKPIVDGYFIAEVRYNQIAKAFGAPSKGDILITAVGTLGNVYVVPDNSKFYFKDGNLIWLKNIDNADPYYVAAQVRYRRSAIINHSIGSSQRALTIVVLNDVRIPVPSSSEQRAIATVLSDVDALISGLDRLIAKKRAIKQGAMQQLLTGRTRLPGFSGEWHIRTFADCFNFLATGSNSRSELSDYGDTKYIHYGDIHKRWSQVLDCEKDSIPRIESEKVKNLPFVQDGDLVIADASEDYEGIGASIEVRNVGDHKVVAGLHTLLLRGDKTKVADGYKANITSIKMVKDSLIEVATGISVFGISKRNLRSVKILLPPTTEEQEAIASVLSDMDAEIAALEQRRDKTRALKQGMMQELLTGKTRLV